jgi:DtxR family Mn-dependent transcriptional regulator
MVQITVALSASLEDYLETIFHIEEEKHAARAKDVAERLQVSAASVTAALRSLAKKKLINYTPYDLITLTTKGKAIAEDVVLRHETLREFFIKVLAIDPKEAEEVACKMEHAMSENILERLAQFVTFLETCPRGGTEWLKGFASYCEHGKNHAQCEQCLAQCVETINQQWLKNS